MAIPVLIIGKSGMGKSASLRNCAGNPDWNLITKAYKEYKGSAQSFYDKAPKDADGFMNIPDGIDEELPFN